MQYNLSEVFKYLKLDWSNEDDLQFFEDEFNQTHTKDTDSILEDMLVNRIRCSSNGVLTITIEVPRLLCSRQILYLEKKFEKHFSVPQVIIRQKANFEVTAQDKKLFLEGIDPWIIKHAKMSSTMEGRLFAQGKVHVDNENLIWKLDENHFDLANNKDRNWLEDFWDKYGCLSCDIRLEACQDECSDKLIEQTEQLVAEANSLASELYQNKLTDFKNNTARSSAKKAKSKQNKYRRKHRKSKDILWGRTGPEIPLVKISEINNETDRALIEGEVFLFQTKITRNGRLLVKFAITDLSTSISCTIFTDPEEKEYLSKIIENQYIKVTANVVYDDRYAKDFVGRVTCIEKATKPASRQDNYPDKRVELHIHSKLSAKDGTINPKDIVKTAADFGHPAVAITDHGVVQAFPEVCQMADELASKGKAIKIIYGLEGYLLDDGFDYFAYQVENIPLISDFIIFNLSCTGDNPKRDQIWKISALKYSYTDLAPEDFNNSLTNSQKDKAENKENQLKSACLSKDNYKVIDEFQAFINIKNEVDNDILQEIEKQAGSIENIQEAKSIKEVLLDFSKFCQELPMIALDAINHLNFLRYGGFDVEGTGARIKFNPPLIDLSGFAKAMSNGDKTRLKLSTDNLNFLANEYIELLIKADVPDLVSLNHLSDWKSFSQLKKERKKTNHIILLAEDLLGLYNLYRLCSASHLDYFYYSPRIPRSLLSYYGAGIIKGMACIDGEIFSEILTLYNQCKGDFDQAKAELSNSKLVKLAQFYNFLEIQPLTNNAFLLRESDNYVNSIEDLQNLNKLVIELGKLLNMPVCATGDVHFLNPEDQIYRKILMSNMNFEDMEEMADLHFRTTDEMLAEFSYLGQEIAHQVVIDNPNKISNQVEEKIRPFPKGSFPPLIKSADRDVRELTMKRALEIYGYQGYLPEIVDQRIQRELSSIIDNGFAVMYYISHSVVKKSNQDGFIVGSRGSVGSSLVATLCDITEVNPLQPHYVCPNCRYSEFDASGDYGSGFDLPAKKCPKCGSEYNRDGQDIPFETFLGFAGDKQPDIDLNFSGFYQARAHQFIEEMFGAKQTFRAGTISSYAEKNSAGMVLNYFEEQDKVVSSTEVTRLAQGLQGIKVTTGQHPGGIVVIPEERDVYDFTPIQYPANKKDSGVTTTHFDFHSLDETILKLDILGHDDPSMLKMMGDLTGIKVTDIPIPDDKVMSLFHSTEALGIPDAESTINSATIGLPELGTFLVRSMIAETKPKTFFDLVQISGLSHGTDVWSGNAQDLIKEGICTINEVIGCRDNIMTYLIYQGLPKKNSFDIMEDVRKGRGLSEEHEALMKKHNIPEWYINSCQKIKYMFPKAHAVAYLMSALRIAWFKIYYPEAYYCAFFTIRANEFSSEELCLPAHKIKIKRVEQRRNWEKLSAQERKRHFYLELVEEMQARSIEFLPIDLEKSKALEFYSPTKGKILPPFNAIPNISDALAKQIVSSREEYGQFKTQEELSRRAGLGQVAMESLAKTGLFQDIPESAQIDLFSLF